MKTVKLLFIDDDSDDRELFSQSLLENNINAFLILESGEKAFEYVNTVGDDQLPEVIITDLNMPGMGGFELISQLKSIDRFQKIPIFILTTSSRSSIIDKAVRHGAAGYYKKPSSINELRSLMQEFHQMAL